MPADAQWLEVLGAKIRGQRAYFEEYDERYTGSRILQLVADEYREVYGSAVDGVLTSGLTETGLARLQHAGALGRFWRMTPPRTGMAAIGVDALVDRMLIDGFDLAPARGAVGAPVDPGAQDARLVQAAQASWDDNDLDVMHTTAQREALIGGRAFGLCWPGQDGRAVVSIESMTQVAVHRLAAPPYDVDAALKLSVDEWTGEQQAMLWIGGRRKTFRHSEQGVMYVRDDGTEAISPWVLVEDIEAPFDGVVPVVEIAHWTRLLAEPCSAIEPVASLVDEADLCEALQVFAGHFGAVPIRFATGLPIARDPKDPTGQTPLVDPRTGKPFIGFNARADHLWTSTSKDTQFGQLVPASLDGFVTWSDAIANKIRAKQAVPEFYYGTAAGSHITGETLKVEEAPMIRRVLSVRRSLTQPWRRLSSLQLSLDVPGVRASDRTVVPRWGNPETRIEAQATDQFQKQVASGVPIELAARETLGWSPDVIQEMKTLLGQGAAAQPSVMDQLLQQFGPKPDSGVAPAAAPVRAA